MRTIKESLLLRLAAQAAEADQQGLTKVASSLTDQVEELAAQVRDDESQYHYASEAFQKEINNHLWSVIIRIADFHDINYLDASKVQEVVDKVSDSLVRSICVDAGVHPGVGAYESSLPGEK